MDLFQVDDDARLFISPAIEDWASLARYEIDTVIDLEGQLDTTIDWYREVIADWHDRNRREGAH